MNKDDPRDFVTRQYAGLIAAGMTDDDARARLTEVLGAAAAASIDVTARDGTDAPKRDTGTSARLMAAASRLGANAAQTHASFVHARGEARLLALDWWRPIRTFLLYIGFLLALATVIAVAFAVHVLPAFQHLNQAMGVGDNAASWADNPVRLFVPLILIAIVFAALALLWWRMRQRMAKLVPFVGLARFRWLYGRSGAHYHSLLCLEYAAALHAGGAADDAVIEPALRLAGWPSGQPLACDHNDIGEKLETARRLGTFSAELAWQRREHWSATQARLELARDRLTLLARVIFYVLIGYMVIELYSLIFSIASLFGVHA
ncbi:MAG TPA: hypothetical protein VFJ15_12800 [Oleiagrimonas sp.]|nr:hypothetical protein [Oleiagrimonas sp.]